MENEREIRRKFIHLTVGIILVTLIYYGYMNKLILGIITIGFFVLLLVSGKWKLGFIEWIWDRFERPETRKRFPGRGPLFYLVGAELSIILFSKDVAMASIIILAIGDSIPSLVGMQFGRLKSPFSDKKFIEGAIVGVILASLGAHIFVNWYEALISASVAVFLEGIDMKIGFEKIDDNLIIPLSAGIAISLIRWIV